MIYLKRETSSPLGTFGTLYNDATPLCKTCERPANDIDHPCIPAGVYSVQDYDSPTKGDVWMVMDVPGRRAIEIHPGNFAIKDSLGCILVGDSFGTLFGLPAVLNSRSTFAMLKTTLPESFTMVITDPPNSKTL